MVETKFGLEYLHRPTIERLGLVVPSLVPKHESEVIVAGCNVGMILVEVEKRPFCDGHHIATGTIVLASLPSGNGWESGTT